VGASIRFWTARGARRPDTVGLIDSSSTELLDITAEGQTPHESRNTGGMQSAKVSPVDMPATTMYVSHSNDAPANAANKHVANVIVTAKYNVFSFLPRNLYEQFSRLANVFFLIISCLQLFTDLSPTSKFATAGPLAIILMLNMVRELFEDSARHKGDAEVNNRLVEVVRADGGVDAVPWKAVQMGDICNIKCNQEFPADLVVLSSSGDQGMCYIDTCNLDGETRDPKP